MLLCFEMPVTTDISLRASPPYSGSAVHASDGNFFNSACRYFGCEIAYTIGL